MFVGHLAVALAAKTVSRQIPLSWLVAASFGLDLVWPIFLLAGIEDVRVAPGNTAFTPLAFDNYPWSHSLAMTLAWAILAALLAGLRLKNMRAQMIVAVTVLSHWILDFVTHRPDLPLWPNGPEVGLGLWNSIAGTFIVEGGLFSLACAVYVLAFPSSDRLARWALAALIAFTTLIWMSGPWAPPPPNASAVAIVALAMWLFPIWAGWIERRQGSTT